MFGAGNIGRGFIGLLLERAGYHVKFADVVMPLVDEINRRGEYVVHVVADECTDETVKNVSAINSQDPQLAEEIVKSGVITTAVGLTILPRIAPAIAAGIKARRTANVNEPLHIIACENAIRATSQLKKHVEEHLDEVDRAYAQQYVGFLDCEVDRIVPPFRREPGAPDMIDVTVERHFEWTVERGGLKGELDIPGMHLVDKLDAYLERKLFAFNGAHAVTAYLGERKGIGTLRESIENPEIEAIVAGLQEECSAMLVKRHGFQPSDMADYCKTARERFRNPHLTDETVRVGREPLRKLAATDRLVQPMTLAMEYGLSVDHYITGIAAALHHSDPNDAQSVQLRELIAEKGVRTALEQVSGIPASGDTAARIEAEYTRLAGNG